MNFNSNATVATYEVNYYFILDNASETIATETSTSELPSHCLGAPDERYNNTYMATGYSYPAVVGISVLVGIFCLYVLLGNVAVIVVIHRDRVISSQPHNQYLVSLAVADALLAVLVIPFTLVNELSGAWPFGLTYCKIYLAADVVLCTASIWSICAIGLDRYWSVKQPITNRRKRTKKVIRLIILAVWALSFVISVPPFIFGFKIIPIANDRSCFINNEEWYIVFSSTLSFFLPAIIIAPVYTKIYFIGRQHSRPPTVNRDSEKNTTRKEEPATRLLDTCSMAPQLHERDKMANAENGAAAIKSKLRFSSCSSFQEMESGNPYIARNTGQESIDYACLYSTTKDGQLTLPTSFRKQMERSSNGDSSSDDDFHDDTSAVLPINQPVPIPQRKKRGFSADSTHSVFSMTSLIVLFKRKNRTISETTSKRTAYYHKRERRFTLIICIVTGGFLVCWYPFFQTYAAYALCGKTCCIDKNVFKGIFWLGYLNSGLNPAIYTIFNKEFRRAFRRLFFGKRAWKNIFYKNY